MKTNLSLDVIIPSFRLEEKALLPILSLKGLQNWQVNFIVIADNPQISIPETIKKLSDNGEIRLIVNKKNLGVSATRNEGIEAGSSDWILLFDDDIEVKPNVLHVFCKAIENESDRVGFIGITNFPAAISTATKALKLNSSGQYNVGRDKKEHVWFPTANIVLNREKLGNRRFLEHLVKGGEDIELFSRNCFENGQKYLSLPEATVIHPWWDNGKSQLKRMFNYGWGLSDIINLPLIKPYSYFDFFNLSETVFFLLITLFFAISLGGNIFIILYLISISFLAELMIFFIKAVKYGKVVSIPLAFQMMLHKNAFDAGYLIGCLRNLKFHCLAKRLDVGFNKPHPSPFRFNRWKIIKIVILGLLSLILIF